jgi:hypothetical protein
MNLLTGEIMCDIQTQTAGFLLAREKDLLGRSERGDD